MANNDLNDFAKLVWGKRSEGLPVPELNLKTEVTPEEVENILRRYAFVQIINPEALGENEELKLIRSKSGWMILDYGNAMSASPGEMLFDHGTYKVAKDGTMERVCSGLGTNTLQIIATAADMVRRAKEERHWQLVHVVEGHPLMAWAIWKAAQDLQLPITGFEPSKEDEAKYQRILKYCPNTLVIQPEPPVAKQP